MAIGVPCPYCGVEHIHEGYSGHRLSKCKRGRTIRSPWSKWMSRSDGYYWWAVDVEDFESMFEDLCAQVDAHMDEEIQTLLKP